ncbi:response regulator [Streptomyces natalensis]|uniref:Response regulator receiver protein n=1 Tax=Streptomyces natalensis ATCC 27448 TaxID=1240678 RepID=A0A0D7CST7_9ACTN|nr:response regulator [Streptomyces natalensis]KIZ19283.1 response regulator receiver protein [Streptomyces natalensis ATCC 27448]
MTTAPEIPAAILIVDDMEENLVALEAVLGSLSQRVVRARSGEEALKAMLREEFAVVLIDVMMPGMNGFETAANIKGLDQTKDVPIILLTGASVDPNYAYRGYTVGAADFLIKPFDPWLLRTKVNVFLELHRKNHQLAAQAEQLKRLLTSEEPAGEPAPPAIPAASPRPAPPVTAVERPEHPGAATELPGHAGPAPPPDPFRPPEPAEPPEPPVITLSASPPETHRPADADRPRIQDALTTTGPGEAARLAEVVGELTEIESLLRDKESPESAGLADRIAGLEQAVGRLMVSRGT